MAQLSPIFNIPYFTDNNGDPLAGGRIYAYAAGSTSTLKTTFIDQDETAQNPNPIVLDAAGRLPGGTAIWLTAGELYNLVLTMPDGTTVLKSFDDISGVIVSTGGGGGGGGGAATVWVLTPSASYLSINSFLVPGNFAAQYALGNRVRVTLSSGYSYGVVTSVSFSGGNTSVTVQLDGVNFNPSLSAAEYSILFAAPNETVDAGGVSYFDSLPYVAGNTVGNKIKAVDANVTTLTSRVNALRQVWLATGTGGTYTATPAPALTSYAADQIVTVRFQSASTGPATINFNGLGPVGISQYNNLGALGDPVIAANQVSDLAYNGSIFVLLDSLAPTPASIPRGIQTFTGNGTYTVPPGVTTIKVTCVGGGGGGAGAYSTGSGDDTTYISGGAGGGGATAVKMISTSPGTTYSMSIGAGGAFGDNTNTPGNPGGSTSFGISLVVASGGLGGTSVGGVGGSSGTGDYVTAGQGGGSPAPGGISAAGGGSFGAGGRGTQVGLGAAGTAGTAGVIIVEY